MSEHDEWRFRGAIYSAMRGHGKAIKELLEMLADERRQLTYQDRLALKDYIEHLTAKAKPGRQRGKIFSRAWLVRQFSGQARREHQQAPGRSLQQCAEKVVEQWRLAELARLTAEYEGVEREKKLAGLPGRISRLITSVQTELRGRGVAKSRRGKCSRPMQR